MASNYTRRINIFINGKEVKNEIADIRSAINKLVNEQSRMTLGSKEYIAHTQKIRYLKGILSEHNEQLKVTQGGWDKLRKTADGFNRYFGMLTAGVAAITGFVMGIKSMLTSNSQLSDSMADVAKSTGMSMSEVKDLNKELRKIDTRSTREELLNLAYVAGKLGYTSKNDVLGFVRAADQIGVALSKDLGGNVEAAVNDLGKITDIFKVKGEFGIEQALLKTGSAINALGAASTANEAYIVDFTKRLGGIAPQAGISVQNVMGLAATLDQLGQQTETSSTALTQLITKMHAKPGDFAKIAGKDVAEFTNLVKTDANAALILLLKGLQSNKGGLTELAGKFSDLGVDGTRSISVIGALANNIDILTASQKVSNEEFKKGTSLTNEFNIKNDNMASNLEKVTRGLKAAFVNSDIMDGLNSIVSRMADWFKIPLSQKIADETVKVNMLVSQITDLNISAEERNKLYNELKSIAPSVLDGINSEAISVATLTKNLNAYNEQMVNRIILQQKQEEIESMAEDTANTRAERIKAETALRKGVMEMQRRVTTLDKNAGAQMTSIMNDQTKSFAERIRKSVLFVQTFNNAQKNFSGYKTVNIDKGFDPLMNIYLDLLEREGTLLGNTNTLTSEKIQLINELGLNIDSLANKADKLNPGSPLVSPDVPPDTPSGGDADKNGAKALEDKYKQQQDIIKQAEEAKIALLQDGYYKELALLQAKFMQEREATLHELETNKNLTIEQKDILNQTLKDRQAKYDLDESDLQKKHMLNQLKTSEDIVKLKLEATKEGSATELALKIQQLDLQQQMEIMAVSDSELRKAEIIEAIQQKYAFQRAQEQHKYAISFLDAQLQTELTKLQANEEVKINALNEKYKKGQISKRAYKKELIKIQQEYALQTLAIALKKAEDELALQKAAGEDTIELEKQIAETKLKISKGDFNVKTDNSEAKGFSDMSEQEKLAYAADQAQTVSDAIFEITKSRAQAELDLKLSTLEKQRAAELKNKYLTEAQKEAINAKFDKKATELKKAQFKKQKAADIIQAVINTALSVTRLLANPPAAIAAGIAGAAQIAVIASQPVPEYYDGGYTSRSSNNKKPAGIVHANEYVVPVDGVSNPSLRPILDTMEHARQKGTLHSLNMDAILNATSTMSRFQSGGFTSSKTASPRFNEVSDNDNTMSITDLLAQNKTLYTMLLNRLNSPIEASVAIRGRNGLYEKMQEDDKLKNNASL